MFNKFLFLTSFDSLIQIALNYLQAMANNLESKANLQLSAEPARMSDSDTSCVYHIKWITWKDEKTPIIMQNKNGPCPLLALFNVLLLSKRVTLSELLEMISSTQIMDYVGANILENMPDDLSESDKLNYEQNMSDAMSVFPKLLTGIDVNIQFKSVSSFEYTPELVVFDLLRIPLLHGWLPDPQDSYVHHVLHNQSYNQVVEDIIRSKDSTDEACVAAGLAAEQFLDATASQLTYHGVVSLLEEVIDGQLVVLFRNNHFSTLYKNGALGMYVAREAKERDAGNAFSHVSLLVYGDDQFAGVLPKTPAYMTRTGNELFTLVTDQGFLTKPKIVWETLSGVQGDTHFTDANFASAPVESSMTYNLDPDQQLEQDLQVALSLQEEETPDERSVAPALSSGPDRSVEETDREMAHRLQRQLDEEASAEVRRQQQQQRHQTHPQRSSEEKSKCIIL